MKDKINKKIITAYNKKYSAFGR